MVVTDLKRFTYRPAGRTDPAVPVPDAVAGVLDRPHRITATVEVPPDGADGVLLAHGGVAGGYVLFVRHRRLRYTHTSGSYRYERNVTSTVELPSGPHRLGFEFEPTGLPDPLTGAGGPGHARLTVDGSVVGYERLLSTAPSVLGPGARLTCGWDPGPAISSRYLPPFGFTGVLRQVLIEVGADLTASGGGTHRRRRSPVPY